MRFKDGNKKWSGYRHDHIVIVEQPPGNPEIHRLQLVDVHDPGQPPTGGAPVPSESGALTGGTT